MVLPPGDQDRELLQTEEGVAVEADHDHVDDDAPLDPVLPVEEVLLLTVHQLEHLLGRQDQSRHQQQDPDNDGGPGDSKQSHK